MIRDKIGVGEPDMMLGAVNRADIDIADREDHAGDVVAIDVDHRVEPQWIVAVDALALATEAVPEVYERLRQVFRLWPANAQMGVAPLGRVELADVVAADERYVAIYHQQLAVIQPVAARVEDMPRAADRPERQDVDGWSELLEGARHDQIAERVVDDVDGDPLRRLRRQPLLEQAPDGVVLP